MLSRVFSIPSNSKGILFATQLVFYLTPLLLLGIKVVTSYPQTCV